MRKLLLLTLLLLAVPLYADSNRAQSYFTYDDGGTIVKQGDDGKEVEARVNFPVYPGDEVTTSRRGRAEIRLSDGNVIALDRSTQIRFSAIRDSYDGDAYQTVIELVAGHVMLQRDDNDRQPVRLDTEGASFAADERSIYAVEFDRGNRDRVAVYDGTIEVRTPSRSTKVHAGEEGRLDDQGLYDLVSLARDGADDFERWFLRRSQGYRGAQSRYLDSSLAYSDQELGHYGNWVYLNDYGSWCWRPTVTVGWRPYYNGYWHHGRGGALVWVSYEPWGWVPYHYGRWSYDPGYGWVWLPGYAYSPAWVYWMYGPGYIGWAPAGWYDCYRPYYGWAYRPYARVGINFGFGFYGRVRIHDIDLRPWTFVSPGNIVSTRVDRAALAVDAVRARLTRENGGFATVTGSPARFTRSEIRDPASAVNHIISRGAGGGTGKGSTGSAADMTSFFRRDPALSAAVRDHIVRSAPAVPEGGNSIVRPRGAGSGIPSPGTSGTLEGRVPRDGGGARRVDEGPLPRGAGAGTVGGSVSDWRRRGEQPSTSTAPSTGGTIRRDGSSSGNQPSTTNAPTVRDGANAWRNRGGNGNASETGNDRNNVHRERQYSPIRDHVQEPPSAMTPPSASTNNNTGNVSRDNWRSRNSEGSSRESARSRGNSSSGSSDVPRRIIDGIGGARVYSGDRPSRSSGGGDSGRSSAPPPQRSTPRNEGGGGGGHNSGGNGGGGSHSNSGSSNSGGGSHNSGGGEHHSGKKN